MGTSKRGGLGGGVYHLQREDSLLIPRYHKRGGRGKMGGRKRSMKEKARVYLVGLPGWGED